MTLPRKEPEVERALPLAERDEPLVMSQGADGLSHPVSRQVRRQQFRAQVKAAKRAAADPNDTPVTAAAGPAQSAIPAETDALAPLPRNKALAIHPRGLSAVGQWLRSLVMVPRRRQTPASAAEIQALSQQLASVQRALDRLLANAT